MAYETFMDYFNAKSTLLEDQSWYYLTRGDKGVNIFPKGIYSKVNVIAWLQFELTYFKENNRITK